MFGIAPLLLVLPLLGFLFNALAGRRFVDNDRVNGEKWTGWVAVGASMGAFVVTLLLLLATRAAPDAPHIIPLFDWINVPSPAGSGAPDFYVPWEMQIDTLSVTMLMVITGVGSLIHIYAIGYMHGDENFSRFFAYLNLFMFFMIMLVTGSSYLTLFVGWEGVGLASFLLIGFWFSKDKIVVDPDRGTETYEGVVNSNAARKAFVANRVGDLCMIVAMSLTFWVFGSLRFVEVFDQAIRLTDGSKEYLVDAVVPILGSNVQVPFVTVVSLITLLMLLGAAGKSAQIPLFVWLPDAMAGPTPVSALMHAATMVTSGIYLLVRSNVLLEIVRQAGQPILFGQTSSDLVALFGACTALYAGLIAFTQFDIKKVLAYSTVSQLGFMIAAVGMGAYVAAMFHLITHAFFKALLFMGAGSVIHGMEHGHHHLHDHHGHGHDDHHAHDDGPFDPQDMRYMGGLLKKMPITGATYIIGALALSGIVPLAGFWSKDEILLHASANGFRTVNILLTLAAFCTAFYMGRQLKMVFFGQPRHEAVDHVPESAQVMTRPLVILAILSIVGGIILNQPYFRYEKAVDAGYGYILAAFDKDHSDDHADDHGDAHGDEHHEEAAMQMAVVGENLCEAHHGDPHPIDGGFQPLLLEHWLEPSITGFCLSEKDVALLHQPHTPPVFSPTVAGLSTAIAVLAMAGSFFFVYGGNSPATSDEKDPIFNVPGFGFMSSLPLNSLYSNIRVVFNGVSYYCAQVIDWVFYHDFVHDEVLRGTFQRVARFASNVLDGKFVDGTLVLGSGRLIRGISNAFKQIQSGYVRNYALTLFLGVVALVVYFVFMTG